MYTDIKIHHIAYAQYEFKVTFMNNTEVVSIFPAQRLRRAAARVGLLIQPQGAAALDAIEFEIISYVDKPQEVYLKPGEAYAISLLAEVKKIGKASWGLVFEGATYKIDPDTIYSIQFSLDIYHSGIVEWSFSDK